MSSSASLPRARVDGLITTETASDLLIYDVERNELHTLNAMAAAVWRAADGSRSVLDLALDLALDPRVVEEALGKLSSAELLTGYSPVQKPFRSASRRRMLKTAFAGAIVVSVSAPMAAAANSDSCFVACTPGGPSDNQCRGFCSQCSTTASTGTAFVCCNPGTNGPEGCTAPA